MCVCVCRLQCNGCVSHTYTCTKREGERKRERQRERSAHSRPCTCTQFFPFVGSLCSHPQSSAWHVPLGFARLYDLDLTATTHHHCHSGGWSISPSLLIQLYELVSFYTHLLVIFFIYWSSRLCTVINPPGRADYFKKTVEGKSSQQFFIYLPRCPSKKNKHINRCFHHPKILLCPHLEGISAFYAFYACQWFHFPQSGALAEGTSRPISHH